MLKYSLADLSAKSASSLADWQAQVDAQATPQLRYEKAKQLFNNKNNATFKEIKQSLSENAPAQSWCYYCELDRYLDIEHIRPKRHYVHECFNWQNYIYSCAICNRNLKNDKFAVFDGSDEIIEFDGSWDINQPVPVGKQVLLDLRQEDPLDFLWLDLETGKFVAIGDVISQKRGRWTRDLFQLNEEEYRDNRVDAYYSFKRYLARYQEALVAKDAVAAGLALYEIRKRERSTVLAEMRRQANKLPELALLFAGVPDEIGARI